MIIRPNPGFIIPTRRFVDVGMPQAKVCAAGRYQLHWVENGVRTGQQTPWFDNIILDSGLNRWGTGGIIAGAAIGTGAATPLATDTGLQTQTHYTTTSGTGNNAFTAGGVSPYNNTRTSVYRTTLGALDGSYTEVGAGWASGSMFSRALILDGGGVPTSISISAAQQLDIVYQLSVYPLLTDFTDTVTIDGVDYVVTGRPFNVNSPNAAGGGWGVLTGNRIGSHTTGNSAYNGVIGAVTDPNPAGATAGGTAADVAYGDGSYERQATVTYGPTQGNVAGGILSTTKSWGASGGGAPTWFASFQYEFDAAVPKVDTKTLVLNYTCGWGRRP